MYRYIYIYRVNPFFLVFFTHRSCPTQALRAVLAPFGARVDYVPWPGHGGQITAYDHAVQVALRTEEHSREGVIHAPFPIVARVGVNTFAP